MNERVKRIRHKLNSLVRFLITPKPRYVYGVIERPDGTERNPARLDTKTGCAQFILWKAGEQNHKEDFWHDMGDGWENHFKPNDSESV